MVDDRFARRTVLGLAGVAASTGALAGCLGGGSSDDDPETSDGNGDDGGTGNETESDGGDGSDGSSGDGSDGSSGDGSDGGDGSGNEILFAGESMSWVGKQPSEIQGESNPTITLTAGETYSIGWDEGDGQEHKFEIWNENGTVVGGYETPAATEPGPDQVMEVEASSEMAEYVCKPHSTMGMRGTIEIEDGG
jgi:plastocyanin